MALMPSEFKDGLKANELVSLGNLSLMEVTDLNDLRSTGMYYKGGGTTTIANVPITGGYFVVLVFSYSTRIAQLYIRMGSTPGFYYRSSSDSTNWSNWEQIL